MFASAKNTNRRSPLHAFVAAASLLLVFLLAGLAACPKAHKLLHHDADHADHECAVVLYASGISVDLVPFAVEAPAPVFVEWLAPSRPELFIASPRYLRLPERGPPAC